MSRLSKEQQDLILDFYFRCGDEASINQGRDLIAENPEAAKLYDNLESTLKELDAVKYEPCPDNLVELTIARLNQAVSLNPSQTNPTQSSDDSAQVSLPELIRAEQNKSNISFTQNASPLKTRIPRLRLAEVAAIAAVVLAVSGIGFPVFSNMRQSSWKTVCLAKFGGIGQAVTRYAEDHEGHLPSVPIEAGSPWYRVGQQGSENQSNTRHLWILIRSGYVPPDLFVCPGHRQSRPFVGDSEKIAGLCDFPCRKNISYSYQLICSNTKLDLTGAALLLADRNPLFENIYCNPGDQSNSEEFHVRPDPQLLARMSSNHRGQGQNILRRDGSADFLKERTLNGDDIFTRQGISLYRGTETPCTDGTDNFLVP